ncbi:MAG: hypothetical protein V3W20_14065 [Candidatus Neomarinimicrobiota bacterium]
MKTQSIIEKYLSELYDYSKNHGHDKVETNTILWFFHNYEHGYEHCKGPASNPYEIEHHKNIHIISKEYGKGHGIKRKIQWFKFTKRIKSGWWELESGVEVSINQVPSKFKSKK